MRRGIRLPRGLSARVGLLPDFLIIGAQKSGTTSLYHYLSLHPYVHRATRKEVHFFDLHFHRGIGWYRAHFPSSQHAFFSRRVLRRPFITGEATPYYIFHPHVARRVHEALPGAKLIVLLRNPVDRAYSQYMRQVRAGREQLPFEEAIQREQERIGPELQRMLEDEAYNSRAHRWYSYVSRGLYADQLQVWLDLFPRSSILVESSEGLAANPGAAMARVFEFLGLPAVAPGEFRRRNAGSYKPMAPATREYLADLFRPHNERLYRLIGRRFNWDDGAAEHTPQPDGVTRASSLSTQA